MIGPGVQVQPSRFRLLALSCAFLLLVGTAVVAILIRSWSAGRETIELSNGTQLHLGQSEDSLRRSLGPQLTRVYEGLYNYPQSPLPVEVVIKLHQRRIAGLWIVSGPANRHAETGATIGATMRSLRSDNPSLRLTPFSVTGYRVHAGFELRSGDAAVYFGTGPCPPVDPGGKILSIFLWQDRYLKDGMGDLIRHAPRCLVEGVAR